MPPSLAPRVFVPRVLVRRGLAGAAAFAALLAFAPRPAHAETSGEKAAAAQALFDEAIRLMKAGSAAEACPKLEESLRLDPGMGTQFRLAECYEAAGKLASAWASFVAVADAAGVAKLLDREAAARKRASALAPRLGRLTISVAPPLLEGLEVRRDGVVVARPLWGVPVPVDAGEHVVTAAAPGKKPWQSLLALSEAASVTATVPTLSDDAGAGVAPPPVATRRGRSLAPGLGLAGLAVAGLAVGTGLFVAYSSQKSDAQTLSDQIKASHATCASGKTDPRCVSLARDASNADTFGNASTAGFVVGAAAAAAAVLYFVWPSAPATTGAVQGVRLAPSFAASQGSLFVTGSF